MMTGSTMIVWLREYGLSYTTVGLFSLLHLPYALKFLWSPAIDHLRIPFLSKKLGQQRAWMVVVQSIAFIAFICLSQINPLTFPLLFVALSFLLTTAAATSDMILLAYPIHIIPIGQWGISESMGIFCYRLRHTFGWSLRFSIEPLFCMVFSLFGLWRLSYSRAFR
jgi:PAT family beta-lactamase induction signal transducer AmpG